MASFGQQHVTHILSKYSRYFQNFHSYNSVAIFKSSYRHMHHYKLHYTSTRHFASKQQQSANNQQSTTSPMSHHYTILNIDSDASIDDIKKSYNNLIKQWHPDLYASKAASQQQDAQQKFMLIREAYEVIINHKQSPKQSVTAKPDIEKPSKFTAAKRTPHPSYSYYSWSKKVYESTDKSNEEDTDENEEETEQKYSEYYKEKQTWVGKTIEELYDWIAFLYMRNPSWMQFFLITTACFGIAQCLWHLFYPHINDADPDRIWNVFKQKKKNFGPGYQPSMTAAMESTPNLVALQPHFKGHTLYDNEHNTDGKYQGENDEDYSDIKEDSALTRFAKLNLNSTVNRDLFQIGRKKKKENIDMNMMDHIVEDMKDQVEDETKENIEIENDEMVKVKTSVFEYMDIPLELRKTPMGVLMASYAVDNGDVSKIEEDGEYDWSSVIKRYRKLKEQNENELQT